MYDLAMPKTLNPQHVLPKRLRKVLVVPNLSARKIARQDVCSYCGGPGGTVDHIKPRSYKGKTHPLNVAGACEDCNSRKGSKKLLLYLVERNKGAACNSSNGSGSVCGSTSIADAIVDFHSAV